MGAGGSPATNDLLWREKLMTRRDRTLSLFTTFDGLVLAHLDVGQFSPGALAYTEEERF